MNYRRLFLALELSSEVKTLLAEQQDYLKQRLNDLELRMTQSSSLHLSLVFLGATPEYKLAGIQQAMAFACRNLYSFWLKTAQLNAFPSRQRPSIIWTGVEGDLEQLKTLEARLSAQLGDLLNLEKRVYQPHITLARIKRFGHSENIYRALEQAEAFRSVSWELKSVKLFESRLEPEGPRYQIIHSEPLRFYKAK